MKLENPEQTFTLKQLQEVLEAWKKDFLSDGDEI